MCLFVLRIHRQHFTIQNFLPPFEDSSSNSRLDALDNRRRQLIVSFDTAFYDDDYTALLLLLHPFSFFPRISIFCLSWCCNSFFLSISLHRLARLLRTSCMFDKHCLISVFSFYPFFLLSKWIDIHRWGGSLIFKTRLTNQTNCVCVCVHIIHIYMTIDRNEIHLSRQLKELEREGCTRRKLLNKISTIPPSLSFYTLSGKKTKVERK